MTELPPFAPHRRLALATALCLPSGCGGGGTGSTPTSDAAPYHGVWQTSSVKAGPSCSDDALVDADDAAFGTDVFKLAEGKILGKDIPVALFTCETREACEPLPSVDWSFTRYENGGWTRDPNIAVSPGTAAGTCIVAYSTANAQLQGETLTMRKPAYSGQVAMLEGTATCTETSAQSYYAAYADTIPCVSVTVVTAVKAP